MLVRVAVGTNHERGIVPIVETVGHATSWKQYSNIDSHRRRHNANSTRSISIVENFSGLIYIRLPISAYYIVPFPRYHGVSNFCCHRHIGVARGALDAREPPGRRKFFSGPNLQGEVSVCFERRRLKKVANFFGKKSAPPDKILATHMVTGGDYLKRTRSA